MWWPPTREDVPSEGFNEEKWAKSEETGWMIVLISITTIVWIWEILNFRLTNVFIITLVIIALATIWKLGVIRKLYTEGLWLLYSVATLPWAPFIELYLYIKNRQE
jgi:hypothetical protein